MSVSMMRKTTNLEAKPLGWIWINSPYPVVTIGLVETLKKEAYIYQGDSPQMKEAPSAIVICHNGEEVSKKLEHLQSLAPEASVLMLGLSNEAAIARSALRAGARGFIHVGMQPNQIVRAISLAIKGETVIPRELVTELIRREEPVDLFDLTVRQREILNLVVEGKTNAQIAQELFLSEYTIKQHLRAAYKILGVRNRTEAAKLVQNRLDS